MPTRNKGTTVNLKYQLPPPYDKNRKRLSQTNLNNLLNDVMNLSTIHFGFDGVRQLLKLLFIE